jgi:DeoR/GlpR family transcriptional regulator of sugar metabolism
MPDVAAQRRQRVLELTNEHGIISVRELSDELAVVEMTIRRDLRILARQGAVRRTHGGAMSLVRPTFDFPFDKRQQLERDAKNSIGRAAAELVGEGDTIFMSSGTTVAAMAPHLRDRQRLTVITNSVRVVQDLIGRSVTIISTGGVASAATGSLVGPIAEATLAQLRVRKAFVGTTGVSPDGFSNSSLEEASIQRRIVLAAAETYVLADHTKFGKLSLSIGLDLERATKVITDAETRPDELQWLRAAGVDVIIAED